MIFNINLRKLPSQYGEVSVMENLASHTFVLVNARFCLHTHKRFFVYDKLQI